MVRSIAYGKGRFVASVQGGPGGSMTAVSPDGVNWQSGASLALGMSLDFFAGAFHLVGDAGVYRSSDGIAWELIHLLPAGSFLQRSAHNGKGMLLHVAPPANGLIYTPDLITWTPTAPLPNSGRPGETLQINALAFGAGSYFVNYFVGATAPPGATGYTASTVDGRSWNLIPALALAQGLAGDNGRLVAIVGRQAFASTDGTTFASSPISEQMINPIQLFAAGGRFFTARTMDASVDGVTWAPLGPLNKSPSAGIWGLAYGAGRYVAVGFDMPPLGTTGGVDVVGYLTTTGTSVISAQPAARTALVGDRTTFAVGIENIYASTTYQWRRDGSAIAGATGASYTIRAVSPADAGLYAVEIRNAVGSIVSDHAPLTVVPRAQSGRIINLSVLTSIDAATGPDATFTVGFVVGGAGTAGNKPLLVRAGGPSLARLGVGSPIADPRLELFRGSARIAENDNWGGTGEITEVSTRVGAFPFLSGDSMDAAVFSSGTPCGDNSVRLFGTGGATGTVIAEVYDATPSGSLSTATPRLINVSVLKSIPTSTTLSVGFVLGGATNRTVLIRVIGPSLAGFGVSTPLADPRVSLFRTGDITPITSNDNWGGQEELRAAFSDVGAFPLEATSRDAALLVTLPPGDYVAQASAASGHGTALVEIYESP